MSLRSTLEWYRICTKTSSIQVRTSAGVSESFKVSVGVHQGSALSPFLFTVIMDRMSEKFRKEAPWNMMFADEVVICAPELCGAMCSALRLVFASHLCQSRQTHRFRRCSPAPMGAFEYPKTNFRNDNKDVL